MKNVDDWLKGVPTWALVCLWTAIALGLRLIDLTAKPIWADEFSTIVFGWGQGYRSIPLDQVLDAATLLAPTAIASDQGAGAVVARLMTESNHPPLYFLLMHGWLHLLAPSHPEALLWAARSLAVIGGTLAVPAMFGLGAIGLQSPAIGHVAALLMAVSPFGVYLAQEARHYTLAICWAILALICFFVAVRALRDRRPLPMGVGLSWIVVHGLGIATHYFFVLIIAAEAVVLLGVWGWRSRSRWQDWLAPPCRSLGAVGLGAIATGLVWLPYLRGIQDSELTWWLYRTEGRVGGEWVQPILETLAGLGTMFYLLPIQAAAPGLEILYGILLGGLTLVTIVAVVYRLRSRLRLPTAIPAPLSLWAAIALLGMSILLLWLPTYGWQMNLTYGFRYNFIYFPVAILVVAIALTPITGQWTRTTRRGVILVTLLGLLGSGVVVTNGAYQKTHRPDQVVTTMLNYSTGPVLLAMSHQTHGQTGRLMAIAWELQRRQAQADLPLQPAYILDHYPCQSKTDESCQVPTDRLRATLRAYPRPFDLWLINYHSNADLRAAACVKVLPEKTQRVDGYQFYRYRCE